MKTFDLTISTPDGNLYCDRAVCLCLRGCEGELAVLADHIPLVTAVKPCECRVETEDGTDLYGQTDGGLLSVSAQGVTLLSASFRWKTTDRAPE